MPIEDHVILPEPVAIDGILQYRREHPTPALIAERDGKRELYPLERQKAMILHISGRGPFTFYGYLPPETEGHEVSFYSMNRFMAGLRSIIQTLRDNETGTAYNGGLDLYPAEKEQPVRE